MNSKYLHMRKCILFIIFNLFFSSLLAQNPIEQPIPINEIHDAVVVSNKPPRFPNRELRQGIEGWVLVSFIVDTEGKVQNAMIEDSVGGEGFEEESLKAVEDFVFAPALKDGTPISQSMTRYSFSYRIPGLEHGAGNSFVNEYSELLALIQNNANDDNNEISNLLIELKYSNVKNFYENAWYGWLEFNYLNKFDKANSSEIIKNLRLATMTKNENLFERPASNTGSRIMSRSKIEEIYLAEEYFILASRMLFTEHLRNNEFSAALRAHDVLVNTSAVQELPLYEDTITLLKPHYDQLLERIDSEAILLQTANIGSNSYWVNELLRPSFSIENVNGTISTIDLRCTDRNAIFTFSEDQVWTIPTSWGICNLYLKGEEGATFEFYSIP